MYRRVGFGLAPGQLDALEARGVEHALEDLLGAGGPAAADPAEDPGVGPAADPWTGLDLRAYDPEGGTQNRALVSSTVTRWLIAMATTARPFDEWMRWFWHGHFVSTLRVVRYPQLMVQQLRLLGTHGLADFPSLLSAVTTDPAMLVYLDGVTNKKGAVNENYGREMLELFTLGIGHFSEQDVRAGAEALSGWRVDRRAVLGTSNAAVAVLEPRRHDDTPKTYLGVTGVHDVATVVDAAVHHPACAPFITAKLLRAILGDEVDAPLRDRLAADFVSSGLQIRPLVRAILVEGLQRLEGGPPQPIVAAPVPWTVSMVKATGAPADRALGPGVERGLVPAGQVPMDAPNVSGWPAGRSWLSSSSTVARFNLAASIAALVPAASPARQAAASGDLARLADHLGRPEGFSDATAAALVPLTRDRADGGTAALTVAMAAPDLVIA